MVLYVVGFLTKFQIPILSTATTVTSQNPPELEGLKHILPHLVVELWRLSVVMPIGQAKAANNFLDGNQMISLFRLH